MMFKTLQIILFLLCFIFTQNMQAQYCSANGGSTTDEWIQSISVGSFSYTSGNDGGYDNLTNQTIDLNTGNSYNVTLTPGYSDTQYDEYWRIWIDLNDDNDFNDNGELVYSSGGGNSGTTTGTLSIPSNASTGTTRLRVAMKWVGETSNGTIDNDPPNDCGTFEFGEVEDYTVNISGGGSGDNYCAANGGSTADEWIQSITIGNFSNNSGNNNGYLNATNQTISLNAGTSYNTSLMPGYSDTQYDEYWRIWVDLNKDNDFNDSGELVYSSGGGNAGTTTGSLSIPSNASTGNTRLRVAMKWVGEASDGTIDNNPPNTCGTFEFGEVEDYTVKVNIGSGGSAPVANFNSNITSGNAPLTVNFSDNSTNNPTSWTWNFAGGNPASSNSQNPTVVYNTTGTYQVSLTASNSFGSNTETKTGYIIVNNTGDDVAPVAAFSASIFEGYAPLVVTFFDQSVNNPQTWSWEMPGAAPDVSNLKNPTVTYNNPGTFPVTLTVTNTAGSDSETESMYITILMPVSVENPENGGAIIIAPNPTDGFIRVNVENTLTEITSANIYNNLGQLVKTLSVQNTDQQEFDISELPSGMYMLHLNIGGENYAYSILKK